MKKNKMKKASLILGVLFLLTLLFLTYFSGTIDAMLLPNVKTTEVIRGVLTEEGFEYSQQDRFLVPIKAVRGFGDFGTVFVTNWVGSSYYVNEVSVQIIGDDGMYYEVVSSGLFGGNHVVYSASKSIENGDRVFVLEE